MITTINEWKIYKESVQTQINELPVMYHGTNAEFDKFDLTKFGQSDSGWLGFGVYFTNEYDYAASYGKVIEAKIHLKNPYVLNEEEYSRRPNRLISELGVNNSKEVTNKLKELGYDGIILTYPDTYLESGIFFEVCVFDVDTIEIIK